MGASPSNSFPRPVLKWAGGKSRLVKPIVGRLPAKIRTYYEPFVGSAAVFFALAREGRFERAVLGDQNRELIDVYRALQRNAQSVVKTLRQEPYCRYEKDIYYEIRAQEPARLGLAQRAARTIYLNKTGYNGLYRVNRSGLFNVPFGRHQNPTICDEARLLSAARMLGDVKLEVGDFEELCAEAGAGDAVYFDPPYVPMSPTSNFTAYSQHAFDQPEHERLERLFAQLAKRKVRAVLSNSDTPFTRELYLAWDCECISVKRPINSNKSKRGAVGELLVRNVRARKGAAL